MEFGSLDNLIFLIIPILIMVIMILGMKKKTKILKFLRLRNSKFVQVMQIVFMVLGTLLVVIALLSPQKQIEDSKVKVKGLNIYALIDTSRSMLTEDVYPNRLERAKTALSNIIGTLKGDRIGFIPFSDSAYVQMPLTDDYSITQNYINALDTNLISGGGTNLYKALVLAEKSFEKMDSADKTVIIFSDGGDMDKRVQNFIKKNHINVYSVGVGTSAGGVIPRYENGRKVGFIKNKNGEPVISDLNSNFLKEISKKYYEVNNIKDGTKNFLQDTKSLNRDNSRDENIKVYKKYFQIPLALGMIFLLLGYFFNGVVKDEK